MNIPATSAGFGPNLDPSASSGYASSVRHLDRRNRPVMAFDSQGIALILIVVVLCVVVGGAALWIELR